jgi:hypothetical protein
VEHEPWHIGSGLLSDSRFSVNLLKTHRHGFSQTHPFSLSWIWRWSACELDHHQRLAQHLSLDCAHYR